MLCVIFQSCKFSYPKLMHACEIVIWFSNVRSISGCAAVHAYRHCLDRLCRLTMLNGAWLTIAGAATSL